MAITISGSGITSANIADGTIVNADINSSAAIDGSKLTGAGKVLQVVSTTMSSRIVGAGLSATWGTTGLTATITPSATSSKVFIIIDTHANCEGAEYNDTVIGLLKGSTALKTSKVTLDSDGTTHAHSLTYLDSPSSTSSLTYSMQVADTGGDGGTVYINQGSNTSRQDVYESRITLMEIAQ